MPKHKPPAGDSTPKKGKNTFKSSHNRGSDADTFDLPAQTSNLPLNPANGHNPAASGRLTTSTLHELVGPQGALTDADLEKRHKALKVEAWQWATDNFSGKGPHASEISDLPRLCQNHPELAEYINFLASCPQDETWEEFINSRRTFLAFAVLGKVLEVHVFGPEMFGASDAQVKVLRSRDLEMMHQDGKSMPLQFLLNAQYPLLSL